MRRRFPFGAGVVAFVIGCGFGPANGTSSETGETTIASTSTDEGGTTDAQTSTETGEATDATTDGCTSACDLSIPECDLFAKDCAEGEKCVPWGPLTHCVEIDAAAKGIGDPCTLVGPEDDCEAGSVCWPNGPGESAGTCTRLCEGTFETPTCPDEQDACAAYRREDGWYPLCRPKCDPTQGACDVDSPCEQSSYLDWFVCAPGGLPITEEPQDYCDLDAAPKAMCGANLHCDKGPFACTEGCCYVLCDLNAADTCEFGACLGLTNPAPGLDALGVCKNG